MIFLIISFAIYGYLNAKSWESVSIPMSSISTPSIQFLISSSCSIWIFVERWPQIIFFILSLSMESFDELKQERISAFIFFADWEVTLP